LNVTFAGPDSCRTGGRGKVAVLQVATLEVPLSAARKAKISVFDRDDGVEAGDGNGRRLAAIDA